MKKILALILALGMMLPYTAVIAQEEDSDSNQIEVQANEEEAEAKALADAEAAEKGDATTVDTKKKDETTLTSFQVIKKKFIEGGAKFMALPLICLILGLAIALERLITLALSSGNVSKFVDDVEAALQSGGIEAAKEVCRSTRGPVASIFYQGLDRTEEGIEMVEKAVVSYGSVQMGQMEKGMVWISLFIALAPMLGFMGTVIGMIKAFDDIQTAGDISPAVVAGGIKVALLTTVAGLIVAMILQVFYNLLVSFIDGIVNKMDDASIRLVDMLIKSGLVK
jgi:biopolymer transport protein ExbB